jgi:choline dehydrogenase-like flavoprotein
MHEDRSRGVVGPDFQVNDVPGLYVADTSVWPANIWVNCQATAMGMAHYAATKVAA